MSKKNKLLTAIVAIVVFFVLVVPSVHATTSTKFYIGERVYVTLGPLNVRVSASVHASKLGSQASGAQGTVVGGPTYANGYNWWNINYATTPSGWSVENNLAAAAASGSITPTFTYSPSSPTTGSPVVFNGSSSVCSSTPCSYNWTDDADGSSLGTGTTMSFTFQDVGTKKVRLTINNSLSQSASVEHDVVVGTATVTPTADTTAPSTPVGLTATAVSASQINLSWTASTDNVGVAGYNIYQNGTKLSTTTSTSYSNTGLTASTSYSYTVSAYDAAGNTSAQSTSVSATTQAVTSPTAPTAPTAPSTSCSGTCYYISSTGSDSNSGTSTSAPWKTIAKVQSFQASLKPGDSVLFQKGGVWNEELDITNMNGSSGSPITIGSYGTGAMPVIDGGQTSSASGRKYCIDAINTTFKWITVNGIECRNAYTQGITFQSYSGIGTNGVGIVVENSYIHHDGAGACTNCGPIPTPDPGGYVNQLDAQLTTGVQFLNNTIDHCGGHNCLQVHYDFGNPVVMGNTVGTSAPWCNHNCIDLKGVVGAQVINNIVQCPNCNANSGNIASFYTENGGSSYATKAETITFSGNVSYNSPIGLQVQVGGTCTSGPCTINAKVYNNTFYNSNNNLFYDTSCTGHTLDIQKNIWDGGGVDIGSGCSKTWDYNDDGGVNSSNGNPTGPHDLNKVNPQYVSASTGNFTPQNSTVLTSGANDSVTSPAYVGAMGSSPVASTSMNGSSQTASVIQSFVNNLGVGLNNLGNIVINSFNNIFNSIGGFIKSL